MNNSECSSEVLFKLFLEEVNAWKSLIMGKDSKTVKEFLDSLLLQNEKINEMLTNEEVSQIHSEVVSEGIMRKNKNKSKPKKKWSEKEKKFMIWAVYYFTQIHSRNLEEMVSLSK